jgi:hypothetical protein
METNEIVGMQFSDAHYIAIGKLVIAFQSLESTITTAQAFLMQPKHDELVVAIGFTYRVLNELSFANRLKLLSNYVETHSLTHFVPPGSKFEKVLTVDFPLILEKLRTGIKLTAKAEEKRNRLIHSHWITHPAGGPRGTVLRAKTVTKRNKNQGSMEYVSASAINDIVKEIDEAIQIISTSSRELQYFLVLASEHQNL